MGREFELVGMSTSALDAICFPGLNGWSLCGAAHATYIYTCSCPSIQVYRGCMEVWAFHAYPPVAHFIALHLGPVSQSDAMWVWDVSRGRRRSSFGVALKLLLGSYTAWKLLATQAWTGISHLLRCAMDAVMDARLCVLCGGPSAACGKAP